MTERTFRLILGVALLTALYAGSVTAVWALIGLLLFEGVTGWRVPLVVSRLRYGPQAILATTPCGRCRFNFHAERMLRLIVALLLLVGVVGWPDTLWFLPWFIGVVLAGAGVTNICPMAMALQWAGFKTETS
jgi:hypothetical protein